MATMEDFCAEVYGGPSQVAGEVINECGVCAWPPETPDARACIPEKLYDRLPAFTIAQIKYLHGQRAVKNSAAAAMAAEEGCGTLDGTCRFFPEVHVAEAFYEVAGNVDQAACVIAHELGHINKEHFDKMLAATMRWIRRRGGVSRLGGSKEAVRRFSETDEFVELCNTHEQEADDQAMETMGLSEFKLEECSILFGTLGRDRCHPDPEVRAARAREFAERRRREEEERRRMIEESSAATERALEHLNQGAADDGEEVCPQYFVDDLGNPVYSCGGVGRLDR